MNLLAEPHVIILAVYDLQRRRQTDKLGQTLDCEVEDLPGHAGQSCEKAVSKAQDIIL